MSWIQKLYDTYEQCYSAPQFADHPLLPVSHSVQQAHIEITLDSNGHFRRAQVVPKLETVIPTTEKSAGRTSGEAPHPLCDKVQYCASDYPAYGGKKHSYYASFAAQLSQWCESDLGHAKARAILEYVRNGNVVTDLIREKVLYADDSGTLVTTVVPNQPAPEIFKYLTAKEGVRDQGDALIRWRVESPGDVVPESWKDQGVVDSWVAFDASQSKTHGFCMVTGSRTQLAKNHPKRLRHAGDGAKLISSNDESGFTFLGRLTDADQACGVGFEVTQKAHSALRWLLSPQRNQAFRNGSDQVVVAWAVSGKLLPDAFDSSAELFGLEDEQPQAVPAYEGDAGQAFAARLRQRLAGYRAELGPTSQVVVMALDSATPGRMAMTYYRELTDSEFLDRVESWHESFAWYQNFSKDLRFVGAPSPKDIAQAAYGRQGTSGESLSKATVERLLPCIVDGRPIPRDIVESTVRRTVNREGLARWEWEKNLGISCALFRGLHKKRGYQMALEEERTSRDYLFGRLLAVAEHLEGRALYLAAETRETSAARLMQRFADHPCSTWRTIELSLAPYKTRLRARAPGFLVNMEKLIDGIVSAFDSQDFRDEARLSGEFLLGYHCQRQSLRAKPESEKADEATENQITEGE